MLIITPSIPGYIIIIDFVLGLLESKLGYNMILTIIDKFSKKVDLIPGYSIWSVEEWATIFIVRYLIRGLGIPAVIISNRDLKFVLSF